MRGNSSSVATMPVGLCGEFTISALVRGRRQRAQAVDVDGEPAAVGTSGTVTRWQPAMAMTGEYES